VAAASPPFFHQNKNAPCQFKTDGTQGAPTKIAQKLFWGKMNKTVAFLPMFSTPPQPQKKKNEKTVGKTEGEGG